MLGLLTGRWTRGPLPAAAGQRRDVRQTQEIRGGMIALEIAVNGKRLCVAGVRVGAVSAIVATKRHRRRQRPGRTQPSIMESALLTVSGYTETATAYEFPWWVSPNSPPRLRFGDSVTLRIVDIPRPDKQRSRRQWSKRALEYSEHREYLRLKHKYAGRAAS